MVSPGYTCQQSDRTSRRNGDSAEQAAAPKALPTSTPSQGDAVSAPATATTASEAPPTPDETNSVDSVLRNQIQDAFNKDPVFSQESLKVTLLPEGIELSGDVANGRDRQNAARLAQSYARGKKVLNHIVVRGHSSLPGANSPQNAPANFNSPAGDKASRKNSPPGV
jgi:osmotically-inducible protein OsmY